MTTSLQRRWSFDTSRWGKYARPRRASRDAAAFSPNIGENWCKKFGTALGQRRTLESDVPVVEGDKRINPAAKFEGPVGAAQSPALLPHQAGARLVELRADLPDHRTPISVLAPDRLR